MSKRAEEAALKEYPVYGKWIGNQYGDWDNDINSTLRKAYLQGYEQAEKDTNPREQPEVDLEKDFSKAWAIHSIPKEFMQDLLGKPKLLGFIRETARHFYELGLNTRKEDK